MKWWVVFQGAAKIWRYCGERGRRGEEEGEEGMGRRGEKGGGGGGRRRGRSKDRWKRFKLFFCRSSKIDFQTFVNIMYTMHV